MRPHWASDHDQAELRKAFSRAGLRSSDARLAYVAGALRRPVDELAELTHSEAEWLTRRLARPGWRNDD
jgi:hypothetical protein